MHIRVFDTRSAMSTAAAEHAATSIRAAVARSGRARIVAATAASQMEFLAALATLPDIPWAQVELFHLDEYIGLPADHPASFRRLLREQLVDKTGISSWHPLDAERDPDDVRRRVGAALAVAPADVAFIGVGENAHLAFNDPPANFDTTEPYLVVTLDEACRRQQVGEGWFPAFEQVPRTAISMSIRQILAATEILVIVPDARKAAAVRAMVEAPISPAVPATALRNHARVTVYLDRAAASRLDEDSRPKPGADRDSASRT